MTKEKKKAVSIYMALDRSGSMQGESWTNAIESLNEYIKELKKAKIKSKVDTLTKKGWEVIFPRR